MFMKQELIFWNLLKGFWSLKRKVIDNNSAEIIMSGTGYALFSSHNNDTTVNDKNNETLLYSEKIFLDILPNPAKQSYIYKNNGSSITKFFRDGRLFYELEFTEGQKAKGKHLCARDFYSSNYNYSCDDHKLTITYTVNGPAKNHQIISEYFHKDDEEINIAGLTIENGEIT